MRTSIPIMVIVLAMPLSSCRDSRSAGASTSEGSVAASPTSSETERVVSIGLHEYRFEVTPDTFLVGVPYEFRLANDGAIAHEWAIVPRGDSTEDRLLFEVEDDDLPAGASYRASFTFAAPGNYDFVCFMDEPVSHAASGMRSPITVVVAGD